MLQPLKTVEMHPWPEPVYFCCYSPVRPRKRSLSEEEPLVYWLALVSICWCPLCSYNLSLPPSQVLGHQCPVGTGLQTPLLPLGYKFHSFSPYS